MTPGAGVKTCDRVWPYMVRLEGKCTFSLENLLLYSWALGRQTECIVIMTVEASTKIVNFMIPEGKISGVRAWPYWSNSKNALFLKNLLYSRVSCRQTEYIVMISMEASSKIVNFVTPWAGVLVLECGHIIHKVKMDYFFDLLYSWLSCRETKCICLLYLIGKALHMVFGIRVSK